MTIVPLGPDDASFLTLGALEELRKANHLYLRTAKHDAVPFLQREQIPFESLDAFYEDAEDFEELSEKAATYLIGKAEEGDLVYAVSDPAGDATVHAIFSLCPDWLTLRILPGVTLAENVKVNAGVSMDRVHIYYAMSLDHPVYSEPQIICEINDAILASEVKLWLADIYEDDTEILFFSNAGVPFPEVKRIHLYDLDRQEHYDHRTAVFVPEIDVLHRTRASYEDFVSIIAYLRSPDGCPWDRAQTHQSLRRYMIEEACEAAEAMGEDDPEKIADELGDVLLQIVLNAQIGAEHRAFTERDVTSAVTKKMIMRHEHVFGTAKAGTPEATAVVWEHAKEKERGDQSAYERVSDLPGTLPILLRTQKALKREAVANRKELDDLLARERLIEILSGESPMTGREIGECLWQLCIISEKQGIDSEMALYDRLSERIEALRNEH